MRPRFPLGVGIPLHMNSVIIPCSTSWKMTKQESSKTLLQKYAPDLVQPGLLTQAKWLDIDKDGDQDLLVAMEWNGIAAYINDKGNLPGNGSQKRKLVEFSPRLRYMTRMETLI